VPTASRRPRRSRARRPPTRGRQPGPGDPVGARVDPQRAGWSRHPDLVLIGEHLGAPEGLSIAAPDELVSTDFALSGGGLWAITEDGRLVSFDTRTGDTLSAVRLALPDALDLSGGPGGALLATSPDELARIEPHTGRALWRTRVGRDVTGWTEAGGLIWARSSGQVKDRLSALDPDTGRVVTRVELDDFGGSGITAINDELWLSTVGGNITILRR
jgi:outer membrane protein assembly factor BamB